MPRKKPPELTFQQHIADYLVREHKYGVLEQSDITDTEHFIVEDHLWEFLRATQADTLRRLEEDYGTDAREEIFKALHKELERTPLWMLLRHGLRVRGLEFRLFYPKPRSAESAGAEKYPQNRITFRPHFYFGATAEGERQREIDFVFFLNGLPIVALELKHEKNQNVHDAVNQFAARDHTHKVFQHPFLYLAADTSDVMAATDPRREENFRWHNMGLTNKPTNPNEYPVEFLYREVLSKDQLFEALSFFLVRVPRREAEEDKPESPAFTIFPRYHQARLVRKLAEDVSTHFAVKGDIGRKYLADHSAGSGKTLSMCWLAGRLHSLYKPGTNEKMVDITFILTDRTALDDNIRRDIVHFTHLKDVVGLADRADDLPRLLKHRKSIIVTTQQKFAWILDQLQGNPELKNLRVAFLIDEAHRSQEGRMGAAIRLPFRKADEADAEEPLPNPEDQITSVIREHDLNQLFVASDLMKQIRQTEVVKAAVQYQGEVRSGGPVKLRSRKGKKGVAPPLKKASVQDMIDAIRSNFQITDEEALYIKEVTEEKAADLAIRTTVTEHRDDRTFLEGAYRGQVNAEIQSAYDTRGRYEELSDPKYTDIGGIFDIMAVTVIDVHLTFVE